MNSQTTPVHIRLWHHEFWLLVIADLLLTMSVYMLIPVMPQWLMAGQHLTPQQTGLSMGAYALGLYLLGGQCSWLVQRFRRNVVCMWAVIAMAVNLLLLGYFSPTATFPLVLLHRICLGAAFGLAQMVLTSTLIIDTCESHQRTEANFGAAWFSRFALSLGPVAGLVLSLPAVTNYLTAFTRPPSPITLHPSPITVALIAAAVLTLVGMLLISRVTFPFRTPDENVSFASLDRFFLPSGTMLFVNLLLISTVVGLLTALPLTLVFYALVMGGFLLALLARHFVFSNAELKSEVISGLILLLASLFVLTFYPANPVAPLLLGLAVGIVCSRFLLFFVKLSRHCQRGTSQSTYFLSWETGLALGLGIGYGLFADRRDMLLYTCIALTAAALVMYHFFTHRWFMRHKNR
jgi:MFS family permease